jgi:hypothetical protein
LKQNTLLWANKRGNASIRRLRNADASVSADAADEVIRLPELNNLLYVECVRLLEDGDMIVITNMRSGLNFVPYPRKTIRVSTTGSVRWEISTSGSWSIPTIGNTGIYFVREVDVDDDGSNDALTCPRLIKYSVQDGSLSSDFPSPPEEEEITPANQSPDALILTSHEKFAVYTYSFNLISLISIDHGEVVFAFRRDAQAYILPSTLDDSIWLISPDLWNAPPGAHLNHMPGDRISGFSCLLTQVSSSRFQIRPIEFPWLQQRQSGGWFFDGDSASLFRLSPTSLPRAMVAPPRPFMFPPPFQQPAEEPEEALTDPFTNLTILAADRPPFVLPDCVTLQGHDRPTVISLPVLSGQLGERRLLEIETQFQWVEDHWQLRKGEYFRMMENYLIHHSSEDEVLHLVDFWPSW